MRVWNRTVSRAQALTADGAVVASGPAQAVRGQASGATLTLTDALLPRWRDTTAGGHGDDDLSAVYFTA